MEMDKILGSFKMSSKKNRKMLELMHIILKTANEALSRKDLDELSRKEISKRVRNLESSLDLCNLQESLNNFTKKEQRLRNILKCQKILSSSSKEHKIITIYKELTKIKLVYDEEFENSKLDTKTIKFNLQSQKLLESENEAIIEYNPQYINLEIGKSNINLLRDNISGKERKRFIKKLLNFDC